MKHDKIDPNAPAMPLLTFYNDGEDNDVSLFRYKGGPPIRLELAARIMAAALSREDPAHVEVEAKYALQAADALISAYNEEAE